MQCPTALSAAYKQRLRWGRRERLHLRATSSTAPPTEARPGERFFADDRRPIFLYDGVCNFCNTGVNMVLEMDSRGRIRMAALQSGAGAELLRRAGRRTDDLSSIVYIDGSQHAIKSDAVLAIGEHLDEPFPQLARLARATIPKPLMDAVYDAIANNRYSLLGRTESCRLTQDGFANRFIVD